jgi:hypothetical protein
MSSLLLSKHYLIKHCSRNVQLCIIWDIHLWVSLLMTCRVSITDLWMMRMRIMGVVYHQSHIIIPEHIKTLLLISSHHHHYYNFSLTSSLTLHLHLTSSFSNFAYLISLIPRHESLIYDSFYLSLTHVHCFDSL